MTGNDRHESETGDQFFERIARRHAASDDPDLDAVRCVCGKTPIEHACKTARQTDAQGRFVRKIVLDGTWCPGLIGQRYREAGPAPDDVRKAPDPMADARGFHSAAERMGRWLAQAKGAAITACLKSGLRPACFVTSPQEPSSERLVDANGETLARFWIEFADGEVNARVEVIAGVRGAYAEQELPIVAEFRRGL